MARQATFKLTSISIGNLIELRGQIDRHLAQRRKDLEQQLSRINGYIIKASNDARRTNPAKGIKVKPKYRGPKGETWAGRGMRPVWLAALIKEGHRLDEYLIGARRAKAATSRKRTPTKKSSRKKAKAKAKK